MHLQCTRKRSARRPASKWRDSACRAADNSWPPSDNADGVATRRPDVGSKRETACVNFINPFSSLTVRPRSVAIFRSFSRTLCSVLSGRGTFLFLILLATELELLFACCTSNQLKRRMRETHSQLSNLLQFSSPIKWAPLCPSKALRWQSWSAEMPVKSANVSRHMVVMSLHKGLCCLEPFLTSYGRHGKNKSRLVLAPPTARHFERGKP